MVGYAEADEEVGKAHHAEAYLPVRLGYGLYLLDGVLVHLDDVVEEMNGILHDLLEPCPVEPVAVAVGCYQAAQVNRAQVAGLVRQERLLSAGVRRFYLADMRRRVIGVHLVYVDYAGVAVLPGHLHYLVEDFPRVERAHRLAVPGVYDIEVAVRLDGLHERLGEAHGDVEVIELGVVLLAGDEVHDVRVVYAQYPHVGAPSRAALLYGLRRAVKDGHEGYGAGGDAGGGADRIARGTEP